MKGLTIKELIDTLREFPQDLLVVVDGYESGLTEVKRNNIRKIRIKLNANHEWYFGEHKEDKDGDIEAIYIRRGMK